MERTQLTTYMDFLRLMGFEYEAVTTKDGDTIILAADSTTAPNVETLGYDEIEMGARFDKNSNMIEGYIVSHVAYSPKGYGELRKEFTIAGGSLP